MTKSAVQLDALDLHCVRGERTLFQNLNFTLAESQCLHVAGANGSGKTSLLRILNGINRPSSGDTLWCGQSILGQSDYFKQSAYLGHKDGLKNELTAAENLSFYHQLEGVYDEQLVDSNLAHMGIIECADLTTNKLSFGQRRRLAFARLLLPVFKLWILDEPFTGIDRQGRRLIEATCLTHLENRGMIVLTNHQSLVNSKLADHLLEIVL